MPRLTPNALFKMPTQFVAAAQTPEEVIPEERPEVAFLGRSNVGKSSLINALVSKKGLARTSQTPGRTRKLIFFDIGDVGTLVDMPGYGYAKVSKTERRAWKKLIKTYLSHRRTLRCLYLLIDARRGIKDVDEEILSLLDETAVSTTIVLTKCDKVKGKELEAAIKSVEKTIKNHAVLNTDFIQSSAEKNMGLSELRSEIFDRLLV